MSKSEQPFSTTFTVREHLLVQNIGVAAISLVMGTAFVSLPRTKKELLSIIYGISYGNSFRNSSSFPSNRYNQSSLQPAVGEIHALTGLRQDARQMAIERMRDEAERLGASGVVAVRMKTAVHNWGDCLTLECTATGTAVAVPGWRGPKPFTSLMPAQQFWRLWQSGYEPCGIAIGACSFSDCVESSVLQRTRNQEVGAYTVSFYDAHELAMKAFTKDVRKHGGAGAVGMEVKFDFEDLEKDLEVAEGVEMKYMHLLTHFVITGTAIKQRERGLTGTPPHQRTLRILDLSAARQTKLLLPEGRELE